MHRVQTPYAVYPESNRRRYLCRLDRMSGDTVFAHCARRAVVAGGNPDTELAAESHISSRRSPGRLYPGERDRQESLRRPIGSAYMSVASSSVYLFQVTLLAIHLFGPVRGIGCFNGLFAVHACPFPELPGIALRH